MASFGQDNPKIYPSEAASAASNLLSEVHVQVADKIRSQIQTEVGAQDLRALLNFLGTESNSLVQANVEEKLDLAAKQLEDARAQAAAVLTDADDKTELSLEPDKWLHEIALQKSRETILLANIGHLQRVIDELLRWDEALNSVMPSLQLSAKLEIRLNQLLTEWGQQERKPSSTDSPQERIGNIPGDENPVELDTAAVKTDSEAKQQQQSELTAQKLADEKERQQAEADSSNDQSRKPEPVASQTQPVKRQSQNQYWANSRLCKEAAVDILVQNTTPFVLYITFTSPPDYVWPKPGRAFRAMPGERISVALRGIAGQEIFFSATSPNNPYVRWGAKDQPPVATCGESGPVSVLVQ